MRPFHLRAVVNLGGGLQREALVPLLDAGLGSVWLRGHQAEGDALQEAEDWSDFLRAWPVARIRSAAVWRSGCDDAVHLRVGEQRPPGSTVASVAVHAVDELDAVNAFEGALPLVSPVFAPLSKKTHSEPLGLAGLRAMVARSERPCIALGGLSSATLNACEAAGAAGGAVLGALLEEEARAALVAWMRSRHPAA